MDQVYLTKAVTGMYVASSISAVTILPPIVKIMSQQASSPEPESPPHPVTLFSVQLTYHVPVLNSTKGSSRGKGNSKTKKEMKSKELSFYINNESVGIETTMPR